MRSAIVRIDESRVDVELIDLVKFRAEALGWHFRYPQLQQGTIDQSQFTDNANSYLSELGLKDFAGSLASLGAPQDSAWRDQVDSSE